MKLPPGAKGHTPSSKEAMLAAVSAGRGASTRDVTGASTRFGGMTSPVALEAPAGGSSFFMTDVGIADRQSMPTAKRVPGLNLTQQARAPAPMFSSGVSPTQRNLESIRENSFGVMSQIPLEELVAREKQKLHQ